MYPFEAMHVIISRNQLSPRDLARVQYLVHVVLALENVCMEGRYFVCMHFGAYGFLREGFVCSKSVCINSLAIRNVHWPCVVLWTTRID